MKPILFNTEMVRALLDGTKTVTRRVVKCSHKDAAGFHVERNGNGEITGVLDYDEEERTYDDYTHPPYQPHDILWVRETWATTPNGQDYLYKADADGNAVKDRYGNWHVPKWRPSLHMPKEAARIFLRVTGVRVERLREITEEGAVREGLYKGWRLNGRGSLAISARQAFMWLWETLTREAPAANSWACNPWVWVIEFERCERPKEGKV